MAFVINMILVLHLGICGGLQRVSGVNNEAALVFEQYRCVNLQAWMNRADHE